VTNFVLSYVFPSVNLTNKYQNLHQVANNTIGSLNDFIFISFSIAKFWLNHLMDDHHFYSIKQPFKKKNTNYYSPISTPKKKREKWHDESIIGFQSPF
jgi:hypothetical protein